MSSNVVWSRNTRYFATCLSVLVAVAICAASDPQVTFEPGVQAHFSVVSGKKSVTVKGVHIPAAVVNPWLDSYGIRLGGEFLIPHVAAVFHNEGTRSVAGRLEWSGGRVEHEDLDFETTLPPLRANVRFAQIDTEVRCIGVRVWTLDTELPLVEAEYIGHGNVQIDLRRRFVRLLVAEQGLLMRMFVSVYSWLRGIDDDAVFYTCQLKLESSMRRGGQAEPPCALA